MDFGTSIKGEVRAGVNGKDHVIPTRFSETHVYRFNGVGGIYGAPFSLGKKKLRYYLILVLAPRPANHAV